MSEDTPIEERGSGILLPGGRIRFRIPLDRPNPLLASPPARPFPKLAGYEIMEEIARGGMGVVYKARERELNRVVALKMILPDTQAHGEVLTRFRSEAEAIARLQHPNIVQVFEIGEHDGSPFIAMEYVEGESLASKLAKPMPPREAAGLVEKLARAMQHSHERGILHRDLKPANVLLDLSGVPKVTDFGLAKKIDADSSQTKTGSVIGTPSYMAPEQASGSKDIGPTADVYALGAILFECLLGSPPFRAPTPLETILLVLSQEPVSPHRLNPGVPRDLDTICMKCLAKESAKRYASAGELADDLGRFREGKPIHARPVGYAERAWKWTRRYPWVAGVVLLVPLVVFAGLVSVIALLLLRQEANEKQQAIELGRRAELDSERTALQIRLSFSFISMYQGRQQKGQREAFQTLAEITALSERHPDDDACLELLGMANASYGYMLDTPKTANNFSDRYSPTTSLHFNRPNEKTRRALEEQLIYFDRALENYQRLIARSPDFAADTQSRTGQNWIASIQIQYGHVLGLLYRFTEALERYDFGIPEVSDQLEKTKLVLLRIGILKAAEGEQAKLPWSRPPNCDHEKAMRLSLYLAESKGVSSAAVFNTACVFALASDEAGISPEEKEKRAARAVGFLRRIKDEGYFRSPKKLGELRKDPDLPSIRNRSDFVEVLRSAEAKK